jgi:hypothetical protein
MKERVITVLVVALFLYVAVLVIALLYMAYPEP